MSDMNEYRGRVLEEIDERVRHNASNLREVREPLKVLRDEVEALPLEGVGAYQNKVLSAVDAKLRSAAPFARSQMLKLKEQVIRIPLPEIPKVDRDREPIKPKASRVTARGADTPVSDG